mgnify:CR=1 FL=1
MPKIVDHDERRAHIAEAVTKIIIRDGFDRVTMREIAAEAGYAHGAISRYFPDKESLLTAAFLHVFIDSNERIERRVAGVRGLEALARMSRELLPFSDDDPANCNVVLSFWDRAAQNPRLWKIHHEYIVGRREQIRRFLIEAREDGELAEQVDIETAVNLFSAFNAGWQMMGALVPEARTYESMQASIDAMVEELRREA